MSETHTQELEVLRLFQGHFNMSAEGAGGWTADPAVSGQPTLTSHP